METGEEKAIEVAESLVAEAQAVAQTPAEAKMAACKDLASNIEMRIREILYTGDKFAHVQIADPGAIEKFWELHEEFSKAMTDYLAGKIAWDSADPLSDERTVRGAARTLFIFTAGL